MIFFSRLFIAIKFLCQFGLRPLALFALYRLGLKTGFYKRESRKLETNHPFFVPLFYLPSRDQLLLTFGEEGKATLLKKADEILDGKIRSFGGEPLSFQLIFNEPR